MNWLLIVGVAIVVILIFLVVFKIISNVRKNTFIDYINFCDEEIKGVVIATVDAAYLYETTPRNELRSKLPQLIYYRDEILKHSVRFSGTPVPRLGSTFRVAARDCFKKLDDLVKSYVEEVSNGQYKSPQTISAQYEQTIDSVNRNYEAALRYCLREANISTGS